MPTLFSLLPLSVTDALAGGALQTTNLAAGAAAAPSASQPGTVAPSNKAPSGQSTAVLAPTSTDVPDYEFADASLGYGRYFTATQARMYIGNLFIEELAGCQWVFQENQIPIYGYASELYDAVGNGRLLAQGQLMVHFISEGYMYTVLNEYSRRASGSDNDSSAKFMQLMNQLKDLQSTGTSQQLSALKQQIDQMVAADPTLLSTYKRQTLANATTVTSPNPLKMKVPFDIVVEYEGGGRTVKKKLLGCVLTSNEMIHGDSDSPLMESYGFIARQVI